MTSDDTITLPFIVYVQGGRAASKTWQSSIIKGAVSQCLYQWKSTNSGLVLLKVTILVQKKLLKIYLTKDG